MKSEEWIRARAKELYCNDGEIEVDSNAIVSFGDDPGAFVQAWVWVPFKEEQDDDEEDEEDEEDEDDEEEQSDS